MRAVSKLICKRFAVRTEATTARSVTKRKLRGASTFTSIPIPNDWKAFFPSVRTNVNHDPNPPQMGSGCKTNSISAGVRLRLAALASRKLRHHLCPWASVIGASAIDALLRNATANGTNFEVPKPAASAASESQPTASTDGMNQAAARAPLGVPHAQLASPAAPLQRRGRRRRALAQRPRAPPAISRASEKTTPIPPHTSHTCAAAAVGARARAMGAQITGGP